MDPQTASTLQLIARAFASSPTRYSVTVAPHPTKADAYDVLFSLPTAQAPESPSFVRLTLTKLPSSDENHRFEGLVENQQWAISFYVDSDAVLRDFPHRAIDLAWEHKQLVSRVPLWTK